MKEVSIEDTRYVCEICNNSYILPRQAKNCEEQHAKEAKQKKCKHSWTYTAEIEDFYGDKILNITKECKCGKSSVKESSVENISQEELARLFAE